MKIKEAAFPCFITLPTVILQKRILHCILKAGLLVREGSVFCWSASNWGHFAISKEKLKCLYLAPLYLKITQCSLK